MEHPKSKSAQPKSNLVQTSHTLFFLLRLVSTAAPRPAAVAASQAAAAATASSTAKSTSSPAATATTIEAADPSALPVAELGWNSMLL